MFAPVTKRVMHVRQAVQSGEIMSSALAEAVSPPSRPVYVEVPTDFLSAPVTARGRIASRDLVVIPADPVPGDLEQAGALLDRSERPLIWVGGGRGRGASFCRGCSPRRAARGAGAHHLPGPWSPREGPSLRRGVPPHMPEAGLLWDEADVVVAIGSDFDGMMTQNWRMPAPEHLIAVNVDAIDASKSYEPEVLIVADAAKATRALAQLVGKRGGIEALDRRLTALREGPRQSRLRESRGRYVPGCVRRGCSTRLRSGGRHVHTGILACCVSPALGPASGLLTRSAGGRWVSHSRQP